MLCRYITIVTTNPCSQWKLLIFQNENFTYELLSSGIDFLRLESLSLFHLKRDCEVAVFIFKKKKQGIKFVKPLKSLLTEFENDDNNAKKTVQCVQLYMNFPLLQGVRKIFLKKSHDSHDFTKHFWYDFPRLKEFLMALNLYLLMRRNSQVCPYL